MFLTELSARAEFLALEGDAGRLGHRWPRRGSRLARTAVGLWFTRSGTTGLWAWCAPVGAATRQCPLDAAQRRAAQTTVSEDSTTTVQRHYTDSSDNPGWATATTDGSEPVVSRYVSGINGDLAATVTGSRVTLDVVDPLGSIATTVTLDGATRTVAGLGVYDEYGNAITSGPSAGALSYGWLGGKERAADSSGLVLMGVRLYNSVTGLFTSVDPVEGGNETVYAYPNDPVNKLDLDGQAWGWLKRTAKIAGVVAAGACIVASAGACLAAGAVAFGFSAAKNVARWRSGDISVGRAALDTGIEGFLGVVPAARSVNVARRLLPKSGGIARGAYRAARSALRGTSAPTARRAATGGRVRSVTRKAVRSTRTNWTSHVRQTSIFTAGQVAVGAYSWRG